MFKQNMKNHYGVLCVVQSRIRYSIQMCKFFFRIALKVSHAYLVTLGEVRNNLGKVGRDP